MQIVWQKFSSVPKSECSTKYIQCNKLRIRSRCTEEVATMVSCFALTRARQYRIAKHYGHTKFFQALFTSKVDPLMLNLGHHTANVHVYGGESRYRYKNGGKKPACSEFNSIQFNFYFDFVNVYMIEIHHWPANSKELIEAGQWLQLIHVSS